LTTLSRGFSAHARFLPSLPLFLTTNFCRLSIFTKFQPTPYHQTFQIRRCFVFQKAQRQEYYFSNRPHAYPKTPKRKLVLRKGVF